MFPPNLKFLFWNYKPIRDRPTDERTDGRQRVMSILMIEKVTHQASSRTRTIEEEAAAQTENVLELSNAAD